jgi:diguanylate cyclase
MALSSDRKMPPLLRYPWPQTPLAAPPERSLLWQTPTEPGQARAALGLSAVLDATAPPRDGEPAVSEAAADAAADQDWALMFGAATARLGQLLRQQQGSAAAEAGAPGHGADLAAALQECLEALQQLGQIGRERLQWARAEAASTRAGARQARHQALHDPLTQLPNRTHFLARLAEVVAARISPADAPALLYLDLDGFKAINDQHGHAVGDRLLAIVALRLRRAVRGSDMMSRLGGDEFACLALGGRSPEQLRRLALKLHTAVAAPIALGELRLSISASIGIAICPPEGISGTALLQRADLAMYQAKRSGDRVVFHANLAADDGGQTPARP